MRVAAGGAAGENPWQLAVRERTGAAIVAVERGARVFVEFPPEFRIEADDLVYICGTRASLERYLHLFDAAPAVGREVAASSAEGEGHHE